MYKMGGLMQLVAYAFQEHNNERFDCYYFYERKYNNLKIKWLKTEPETEKRISGKQNSLQIKSAHNYKLINSIVYCKNMEQEFL